MTPLANTIASPSNEHPIDAIPLFVFPKDRRLTAQDVRDFVGHLHRHGASNGSITDDSDHSVAPAFALGHSLHCKIDPQDMPLVVKTLVGADVDSEENINETRALDVMGEEPCVVLAVVATVSMGGRKNKSHECTFFLKPWTSFERHLKGLQITAW